MSYYVPSHATSHHRSHSAQPVIYTSSHGGYETPHHGSSHGHYPSGHYGTSGSHYEQPIYVAASTGSHRSHRSRSRHHHSQSYPQVVSGGAVTYLPDSRSHRHRSSSRRRSSHHRSRHDLTIGERIRRFFGFAPRSRHYKVESNHSSWGFLGHGRRERYVDARTGQEVDKRGRPVYRV